MVNVQHKALRPQGRLPVDSVCQAVFTCPRFSRKDDPDQRAQDVRDKEPSLAPEVTVKRVSCRFKPLKGIHQVGSSQPSLSFDVDDVEEGVPVSWCCEVGSAEPMMVVVTEQEVLDQGHKQLTPAGVQGS